MTPYQDASGVGLTRKGVVSALFAAFLLSRTFGVVQLLVLPFVTLAFAARVSLGMYQYANIAMDFVLGASILLFLIADDHVQRLLWGRCVGL